MPPIRCASPTAYSSAPVASATSSRCIEYSVFAVALGGGRSAPVACRLNGDGTELVADVATAVAGFEDRIEAHAARLAKARQDRDHLAPMLGQAFRYQGELDLKRAELADLITQMNDQMLAAARELQFEVAARLRDELTELKKELRQLDAAHA